jgi:hypothetical protein
MLFTTTTLPVRSLIGCQILPHHVPGNCIFVDTEGLNDQITSTSQTESRRKFRQGVLRKDGLSCVITREPSDHCDVAHLIPWDKGDEVS